MSKANNIKAIIDENAPIAGRCDLERERAMLKLRKACKGMDRDAIKAAILPGWAEGAGIVLNEDGTWPGGSAGAAGAAKKRFNRLVHDILADEGESSNKQAEPTKVRLSKAEREAALALLEACGGKLNRARAVLKAVA